MINIKIIDEQPIPFDQVVKEVTEQRVDNTWAKQSRAWFLNDLKNLEGRGEVWVKGFLPQEYLNKILLPEHRYHSPEEKHLPPLCEKDTPLPVAAQAFVAKVPNYCSGCTETIEYLKSEIKKDGFNTPPSLILIDSQLKHVDGLHRLIALSILISEGFKYEPIPVFLCKVS